MSEEKAKWLDCCACNGCDCQACEECNSECDCEECLREKEIVDHNL